MISSKQDSSVLFIVQAGKKHGIGHLKRCLQIAEYYTKPFILTITDLKDVSSLKELLNKHLHQISSPVDKLSIDSILSEYNFNLMVCDCDSLPDHVVLTLNKAAVPMISFDNTSVGSCSEIFISPLPSNQVKSSNFSEIYYTPIKEEFFLEPVERPQIKNILISLGGSDPHNNAEKIIKALKETSYNITVISGPVSKYNIEENEHITIKYNVTDLFPYIQENDLIFCGPGSTMLESLAAKKHIVVITHTFQQYRSLSKFPYVYSLWGHPLLRAQTIKNSIHKAISGKFNLPPDFHFHNWFSNLSYNISSRPAFCPMCSSLHKQSLSRTKHQNQFYCKNCGSQYIYNLNINSEEQNDNSIADNSEQSHVTYKHAVLNLREDSNRRIQIIKKVLPLPQQHTPYKLMDIGAEHGIFVQEATHNGFSGQGVELSVFARKTALDSHNINIIDSMEKVYENGAINHIVTVWKKIELLEAPLKYIKKLSKLIPVGGMLAFRLPLAHKNIAIHKGFFQSTQKGGHLFAEQAGFIVAHTCKFINDNGEEFLEFYCIKRMDV